MIKPKLALKGYGAISLSLVLTPALTSCEVMNRSCPARSEASMSPSIQPIKNLLQI